MCEPSSTKIGGSLASVSSVVSRRGASSSSTTVHPCGAGTSRDDLLGQAAVVDRRDRPLVRADRPAVHLGARDLELGGDLGRLLPPCACRSTGSRGRRGASRPAPSRRPSAARSARPRAGTARFDIDSMPPPSPTSRSPARIAESSSATARIPEAQTLLIVSELTDIGTPALAWAWREGIIPWPACSTVPITTCSTCSGSTPARSSAPAIATPPSTGASSGASPPPSFADRGAGAPEDHCPRHFGLRSSGVVAAGASD